MNAQTQNLLDKWETWLAGIAGKDLDVVVASMTWKERAKAGTLANQMARKANEVRDEHEEATDQVERILAYARRVEQALVKAWSEQ